ncbi:MAG: FAD-binding oxidoreductase [Archaeoglobus sp.]|nr:FAD-binding oxidoreductase [Archaeoglobus sp.]
MEIMERFEIDVRRSFSHFSFHPFERRIYSHDISVLPSFVEKMVYSQADVIIQPRNVEEVKEILRLSKEYSKPIVPRGAATSGYGGVIPFNGGIVVDFSRMNGFEIDEDLKLVIAEPGAIWWDIQKAARKRGLSLRIYPTSAISSTVGGWIGQGGIGIGSTMFGDIKENVEWLRVLDFQGEKVVEGEDLRYYVGMEGTTGLIISSAVKLMDAAKEIPLAIEVESVGNALKVFGKTKPYSAILMSSEFFRLMNEVKGSDFKEKDTLVAVYLDEEPKIEGFKYEEASEIWKDRFYPLRIKKKGPSLVSVEILLPFEALEAFYGEARKLEIQHAIQTYFSRGEANVIVLIPSDEREKRFTQDWKKAFKLLKIGLKLGGKPYATGLYLSHLSKKVIQHFDDLLDFKRKVDPQNLLNPGKIFPKGRLPMMLKIAGLII